MKTTTNKNNTTHNLNVEPLTLTPATSELLTALRCIAEAESHYYDALTERYGEEKASDVFGEKQLIYDPFGTAREFLENEINEAIRDWVILREPTQSI